MMLGRDTCQPYTPTRGTHTSLKGGTHCALHSRSIHETREARPALTLYTPLTHCLPTQPMQVTKKLGCTGHPGREEDEATRVAEPPNHRDKVMLPRKQRDARGWQQPHRKIDKSMHKTTHQAISHRCFGRPHGKGALPSPATAQRVTRMPSPRD